MEEQKRPRKNEPAPSSKVLTEEQMRELIHQLKDEGKAVVQCHGVFDLLHPGHIAHFEEARAHGDLLIVSVTSDEFVNKGPGRPILSAELRATMLAALQVIDYVLISKHQNAQPAITLIKPDFFVKGPDYAELSSDPTGNIRREVEAVEKFGGRVVFTNSPTMSSSSIINSTSVAHGSDINSWLPSARATISKQLIEYWFEKISQLKVLVIGETILDTYVFVEALGKTSKEPVLAFLRHDEERQLGGSVAVAKHILGLGAKTTLLTRIGNDHAGEEVERQISKISNVESLKFKVQKLTDSQTIVKTRFVDESTGTKVFETYEMSDAPIAKSDDIEFSRMLSDISDEFDLILVADYGHGLLSQEVIKRLGETNSKIAVSTQSNAGNRGFNSLSRYPRVDIVSLNGSELQLELRNKHSTVQELLPDLASSSGASTVIVTEGARGLSIWTESTGVVRVPAFTERVKDRVGAGDALFSVAACLIHVGAPLEAVGLFGNLAGASLVSSLGNKSTLVSSDLVRHANVLLK
jgi:rfaE bifunctional protein kinase chain/domain/rfaE bifunctional protein nucleotidyltransferase chain/domain